MNEFGFVRATDPSTPASVGSMVRASVSGVSPNQMPENILDGPSIINLDGSTSFPKKSSFSIHYEAVYSIDAINMYNEYVAAASQTNALVWVRKFNTKTATWETVLATAQPPEIGETVAQVYRSFEMRFDGVGIDTHGTGFTPGQQSVSSSSGTGVDLGGSRGYGRGAYGSGPYGH